MKFNWKKFSVIASAILICVFVALSFTACTSVEQVQYNIQEDADNFRTYRRMTFINLRTAERMYCDEVYFSLKDTGTNEIGLVFRTGERSYKLDYFGLGDGVTYVIEQLENTTTDPFHWKITWYISVPEFSQPKA